MIRLARLNLVPQIEAGADVNPCTKREAKLYGETLTLAPLDAEELAMFKAQFGAILTMPSSDERKIMLDRLSQYVIGMRAIKHELKDVKFAGMEAGDAELGMSFIRPQFTVAGAVAVPLAYRVNWNIALAANTWTDWFWNGAGLPYTLGKDFGLVVTHLKSLTTPVPFISECRFVVGRTGILIPADTRNLRLADTENGAAIVPIPTMVCKPGTTLYGRCKADAAGTDDAPLGGLVFGLGRALKEEAPTWTP